MIEVTNLSRTSVGYVTGQKNGEPIVAAVEAGETKRVAIAQDHPQVVADVAAGLITVGKPTAKAAPAE